MNEQHPYRTLAIVTASIFAFHTVCGIGFAMNYTFIGEPGVKRAFHSDMENAYYASTPELMVTYLKKAVAGMHAAGLDGMYDDLRPWKQTPDHHMDYEYQHMQAIIDRANDVIKWRDSQGDKSSQPQLGDVYGQKVDALRHFMRDDGGWSDAIAQGAWWIKNHPFASAAHDFGAFYGLFILGSITWPFIMLCVRSSEYG